MKLVASVRLKNEKDRDILVRQIKLLGFRPRQRGEVVTVTLLGHFTGSFISLVGVMDGAEFSQEEEEGGAEECPKRSASKEGKP